MNNENETYTLNGNKTIFCGKLGKLFVEEIVRYARDGVPEEVAMKRFWPDSNREKVFGTMPNRVYEFAKKYGFDFRFTKKRILDLR